jgi:hypothetical protein
VGNFNANYPKPTTPVTFKRDLAGWLEPWSVTPVKYAAGASSDASCTGIEVTIKAPKGYLN